VSAGDRPLITVAGEGDVRVPRVETYAASVGEIVARAHEAPISVAGKPAMPGPAPDLAELERILVYCAERRCEADGATCPGCRLRTQKLNIDTFDEFVARHAEIRVEDSGLRLIGRGDRTLTTSSLEVLTKNWAGEEYWFWARRVLRKMRHGIRRADRTGGPDTEAADSPVMILVRPQLADNIGMVARAMANFGLEDLRLVEPRDGWPNEKARVAASGANYIIDGATTSPTLEGALAGLHWVGATTARQRDLAKPVLTPEQAVTEMRARLAAGQRCGILFGPERNGLETEEVANADAVVMAAVSSTFASLNLAQAVLLVSYEWMKQSGSGSIGRVTTYEDALQPGPRTRGSPPATKEELMAFFEHIELELDGGGFFNPAEKRPSMVQNMRSMFTRMGATQQEIRTLRGIVKALAHPKRRRGELP
jgi:tRNA/rRNA methyltransferase